MSYNEVFRTQTYSFNCLFLLSFDQRLWYFQNEFLQLGWLLKVVRKRRAPPGFEPEEPLEHNAVTLANTRRRSKVFAYLSLRDMRSRFTYLLFIQLKFRFSSGLVKP